MIKTHKFDRARLDEVSFRHEIANGTKDILLAVATQQTGDNPARGPLIAYEYTDTLGNVATPDSEYKLSPSLGTFFYLDREMPDEDGYHFAVEAISVPTDAKTLHIRGCDWKKGVASKVFEIHVIELDANGISNEELLVTRQWIKDRIPTAMKISTTRRSVNRGPAEPSQEQHHTAWAIRKEILEQPRAYNQIRHYYRSSEKKRADQIKVAIICDEFTYNSFSPEFQPIVLNPNDWRETLEAEKPDMFLCESAWSGVDSKTRPWRGSIYRSVRFNYENRTALLAILAYCRQHSIPTAFWNKEDPTHFYDRVNDFVDTAARFDYIFTTSEEMVQQYRKFHPDDRIGVLQFAVQPRDFNPISQGERNANVVFAGAWYNEHLHRASQMRQGFDWILESKFNLSIYDRNFDFVNNQTKYPDEYAQYANPAVSHKRTAQLYRENIAALNINTVTDSKTMFARRAFEIAASGALLVGNYSPGIEAIYGDSAVFYDKFSGSLDELTMREIEDMTRRAQSITLQNHTYRHRFEQILQTMRIDHAPSRPLPTMMVKIDTHSEALRAINYFKSQATLYSRLLLVVSGAVRSSLVGEFYAKYNSQLVDVISTELISTENVPSTNYVSSADVIWVDQNNKPNRKELQQLLIHGEYSRHPIRVSATGRFGFAADRLNPGMRISAIDVKDAIVNPHFPRTVLEVN